MITKQSSRPFPVYFMNNAVSECARLIRMSNNIAALTGAGISTKAGILDFRGPQGLYITKKYDPDKIFDISYFHRDPKPFYEFARDFAGLEETIRPTAAHRFFAGLEKTGKLKGVITQNIDSLHQKAGSKNVLEMHGSFRLSHCLECRREFSYEQMKAKLAEEGVPRCSCGGILKPDIVFYGENVKCLAESLRLAGQADLFFVVGTSCVVYPAAMIPDYVHGAIVIVNRDPVQVGGSNIALETREDIDVFFDAVAQEHVL